MLTINLGSCTHCSESAKQHYIYPYRHVKIPSQIYPFWCICAFRYTMATFGNFFVQKIFVKNLKFSKKIWKSKVSFVMSILKFLYFFWFLTHWHLKLRFVYNTFGTKNSKGSHCGYLHKYCMNRWYVVQRIFKIGALKYYFRNRYKPTF